MITNDEFIKQALAFDEVTEAPHFEKKSFRVRKKIFATLNSEKQQAVLKLNPVNQSAFCSYDQSSIYPVEGTWGKRGWTVVDLQRVVHDILKGALTTAYCTVAPRGLAQKYEIENK